MWRTVIRERPTEVTDSLSALGLSIEVLCDAILAGETARDMCTANDPSNAAGFDAWARTVRSLRERLIALGWTRTDDDGLPTIISPSGSVAIAVVTGDEGTGKANLSHRKPSTRRDRPLLPSLRAIARNSSLGIRPGTDRCTESHAPDMVSASNRVDDTVYGELSLPAAVGDDSRVEEWAERIILAPISLDPERGICAAVAKSHRWR